MRADDPSLPDPPGQSTVRVLRGVDDVALTNEPDPDRLAFDRRFDGPGGGPSINPEAMARGRACLSAGAKGFGFVVLGLGAMIQIGSMIATTCFDVPMQFNKRMVGKREALGIQAGFLVLWAAFGALWLFVVGKVFKVSPAAAGFWRLELGDEEWVLRTGYYRSVLGRVDPRNIQRLSIDRSGRVVAVMAAGGRRTLTGPMTAFEADWAVRALSDMLGRPSGAGPIGDTATYACVPAVDPAISAGTTLKHRLARADHPWWSALGCLALVAFWNGIVGVFVAAQLGTIGHEAKPGWLVLSPFLLIGLAMMAAFAWLLWCAIADWRAGSTVLEVSANPMRPGERCRAFVSQSTRSAIDALRVLLVCEEQVKYWTDQSSPATRSKRVRELEVYCDDGLSSSSGLPFEKTFEFEVPADAMHSLEVPNNKITWTLEVEGGRPDWPSFRRH
jgi:hypothetical protein